MTRLHKTALWVWAVIGLTGLAQLAAPAVAKAAEEVETLIFDVACDCRTGSPGFFAGQRGDPFIVSGKIFPAGTLPSGTANNDPTEPVNGVSPIGDWTCRGQQAGVLAPAYSSSPFAWNTQYFILKNGSITSEGYAVPTGTIGEFLSVTGGIRGFSGASGYITETPFGTNATGCPNFRARFRLQSRGKHD
jgi:hypothetical protein